MKAFLLLATAFSSISAQAEIVQCTTRLNNEGTVHEATFKINYEAGYIESADGVRQNFLASENVAISGSDAFVKAIDACPKTENVEQRDCTSKALDSLLPEADKVSDLSKMAHLGVFFLKLNQDASPQDRMTEVTMDLSKIASARSYQLSESYKLGTPGLYEYMDASGALLGRVLIATPFALPCN